VSYPDGTVERWALDYIASTDLDHKRSPPPPPREFAERAEPLHVAQPGRPAALRVTSRAPKAPGPDAIRAPERRAALVHTFLHHELQAAELLCWAILAFTDAPEAFRAGLLGVMKDELRHVTMYEEHLAALGSRYGAFPVRDWFWQRVPSVSSPAGFVATFGMGLEGANLDHTLRYAERFHAIGDALGVSVQERICAEEIAHVRFAIHWYARFTGEDSVRLDAWAARLPPPLSPLLMRGQPPNREARLAAGFPESFIDELTRWQPAPGS
jgi:uncharacterized ferritin-like protein (DUF455 family)